jgi:hypothetical protein
VIIDVGYGVHGARGIAEAARILQLPGVASAATKEIAQEIGPVDCAWQPIRSSERIMLQAF